MRALRNSSPPDAGGRFHYFAETADSYSMFLDIFYQVLKLYKIYIEIYVEI
jgi:hypothetical protein